MSRPRHRQPASNVHVTRRWTSAALAAGCVGLLAAGFVATAAAPASAAEARVDLGTASSFAVLAGTTVTNTGTSLISGDVGLSPGSSITGFPPGVITGGTQHISDAVANIAAQDLVTAYNDAAGRSATADVTDEDLGGMTLTPGVYEADTAMALTGTLTLNAQGNPDAVFVFKAGSTLVTATASSVQFANGGSPCNVFWQVGSSATLGTASHLVGTILTLASATLTTTASVEGRVLARNGAATLDTNVITVPDCATTPDTGGTNTPGTVTPNDGPTGTTQTTPVTPTPRDPIIPKKHPRTGMGGAPQSSGSALFILAGLTGGAAVVAGAFGFRRTNKS